jgi:hypothetical protein
MDSRLRVNDKAWISAVYPREGGGGNDKKMKIELGQFIFVMAVVSVAVCGFRDYELILRLVRLYVWVARTDSRLVRILKRLRYFSGFV